MLIETTGVGPAQALPPGDPRDRLNKAVGSMQADPGAAHTVSKLARLSGMSRSNFSESFRNHVGRSPMEFLRGLRMDRAADLLRRNEVSIKLVGARVGYTSRAFFSHAFQRCFGVTPAEFRESQTVHSRNDIHEVCERLRNLKGLSQQLAWEVDLKSGKVWWSEGTFAALGFDATARLISDVSRFYERVHPEDRERIVQEVQAACLKGDLAWQSTFRFRRADDRFLSIQNACIILRDRAGAAKRLIGSMRIAESGISHTADMAAA